MGCSSSSAAAATPAAASTPSSASDDRISRWLYADARLRALLVNPPGGVVDLEAVKLRLPHVRAVEVDGRGTAEEPLLFSVLRNGDLDIVRRVLEVGVPKSLTSATEADGVTAAAVAVWRGDPAILRTLLTQPHGAGVALGPVRSRSLLHIAAYRGVPAALIILSEAKPGIERLHPVDADGFTPLMLAAGRGHAPCVHICQRLGMDVTTSIFTGNALHAAAQGPRYWYGGGRGVDRDVRYLGRPRGLNLTHLPKEERSKHAPDQVRLPTVPLPIAWYDVVNTLIGAGLAVDSRNRAGQTPLMLALQYMNAPVVEALLTAGADCTAVDNHGKNVCSYAGDFGEGPAVPAIAEVKENAFVFVQRWLCAARPVYNAICMCIAARNNSMVEVNWSKLPRLKEGWATITAAATAAGMVPPPPLGAASGASSPIRGAEGVDADRGKVDDPS